MLVLIEYNSLETIESLFKIAEPEYLNYFYDAITNENKDNLVCYMRIIDNSLLASNIIFDVSTPILTNKLSLPQLNDYLNKYHLFMTFHTYLKALKEDNKLVKI